MDAVFPLIRKYGGVVIGLALDEDGIPATAEGRVQIAKKIIAEAAKYGIEKKDIVIDALAMTISSEPEGAKVTLGDTSQTSGRSWCVYCAGCIQYFFRSPKPTGCKLHLLYDGNAEWSERWNYQSELGGYDEGHGMHTMR